jgi:dipeptidyl aminopeptidase/acylaminoacyl peptidase
MRQFDGSVVDWLRGQNSAVLMQRTYVPEVATTGHLINRTKEGLGVDRLDLETLKSSQVEPPRDGVEGYLTDGRGNVRLQTIPAYDNKSGNLTGKIQIKYRLAGARDWRVLGTYDMQTGEGIYPLEVDADTDSLYALKKLNGRDALYRIKLDQGLAQTLIASEKEVDIDGVVRLGTGLRVVGYTFADDRRRTVYFDPELSALQKALAKAVPNQPMIDFQGASADGQKLLILVSGDTNPGTFYRFDRTTKQLAEIGPIRPDLQQRQLATVKSIRVTAPDGASIPAYLTLPAGGTGKNLGAVVMPHGGPSARDEWGFDWLAQFLAARGYAVIQPNYRGSAGYGQDWLNENGFRGWRTSIGDVTASAKYLVSQGIADPNRLAILGWSYGGYAALQSAATEPSLYKAAIAIAPVTDLDQLRNDASGYTNERIVKDFVGTGAHLTEGSPLKNVSAIRVPVLLAHGDQDANVAIGHSERMNAALKSGGKPVEFLRFAGLDHQLDDSNARVQLLTRVGTLLDQTIGK